MTAPRAVGVRASYDAMPGDVRDWVDDALGSPVVEAVDQVGGMSPGCATRLRCADGTRVFVKAVGTDLNPDTPTLFRREITVLSLLGSPALWGDLLASYDDGQRVALLLEDVEGTHPDLADDATLEELVAATDELGEVMRARVGARSVDHRVGGTLMEPDGRSDTLVHWDVRVDNLLQRPTGEIVFLDWGAAGVGEAWLDPLLARLERLDQPWFDRSLATSPALVAIGDDAVTTWLVGLGTNLAVRAVTAVDVNLPTLAEFRRVESARFLGAAARRLGVGS